MQFLKWIGILSLPVLIVSCNNSGGGSSGGGGKGFFGEQSQGGGAVLLSCQFSEILCGEFVSLLQNQTKTDLDQICTQSGGRATSACAKPKGGLLCSVPEIKGDRGAVNYYISQGTIEEFRAQCEQSGGKISQL